MTPCATAGCQGFFVLLPCCSDLPLDSDAYCGRCDDGFRRADGEDPDNRLCEECISDGPWCPACEVHHHETDTVQTDGGLHECSRFVADARSR